MTTQEKIESIRQACIKANPKIVEHRCEGCNKFYAEYVNGCPHCWRDELSSEENLKLFPKRGVRPVIRPIRLADVLLAIEHSTDDISILYEFIYHRWNLRADDLTQQSEETITFFYDLLQ
jgi:hypothetical protein